MLYHMIYCYTHITRFFPNQMPSGTEEEMQRLHRIQFKFMPDRQPFSLAASIAANLQVHLAGLGGFMPDRFGHGF